MSHKPSGTWDTLPRLRLAELPSPITALPRFGRAINAEVWLKRDDVGSVSLAGNKIRKLEFVLAEAQQLGADVVVASGAVQSNAARATAAAAARLGLDCALALAGNRPAEPAGNLLIAGLVGAKFRFVDGGWGDLIETSRQLTLELAASGRTPYEIPIGCSSALGSLGFARAYDELVDQLDKHGVAATRLYHASSSGGTQAGLVLGRALAGRGPRIYGIGVAEGLFPDLGDHCLALARDAARLLRQEVDVEPLDFDVDMRQLGRGYGQPTPEALAAITLLARTEGILTDPVYTGKALAAVVGAAARGDLDGPVVLWHTGGVQSLFDPKHGDPVWGQSGATLDQTDAARYAGRTQP